MTLTTYECSVLNKIARKTRMHRWCRIIEDPLRRRSYFILDIENNKRIPLKSGIKQIFRELTEEDIRNLSDVEKDICIDVIVKLLEN